MTLLEKATIAKEFVDSLQEDLAGNVAKGMLADGIDYQDNGLHFVRIVKIYLNMFKIGGLKEAKGILDAYQSSDIANVE